jgi:acyl carrier protein
MCTLETNMNTNERNCSMATLDTIKDILSENLNLDRDLITEESTFDSLNIDSLDMVELICELEDRLGVDLGEPEGIETLSQFIEYVDALR